MPSGLPVSRLISANVNLNPAAAAFANINSLLILGDSDVIDTDTRIVSYGNLDEVAADFGTTAPEYLAAALYFSQLPKPGQVYLGKWARTATSGRLIGAALTTAQQALTNFTAISTGALKLAIDGAAATTLTGLNFSACANLNAVAAVINTALAAAATCVWDGEHFVIKSATTGSSSSVGFPTAPASGTDMKALLGLVQASGARTVVGVVAESADAAAALIDALPTYWYGLMLASASVVDADHLAIAAYIEAATRPHAYGLTTSAAAAIDGASTTDIGSQLEVAGYKRTFGQYSTSSPYAVASMFGRALTTDFNANNSTITLMYKQEPGVAAEQLTTAQADVLDAKRYNYFVAFDNSTAIIVGGRMFGDAYIDEIVGLDWFANRVQTDVWNLLYGSDTKIPQTDAGNQQIANAIEASCVAAVNNGLLGPGTWTNTGFGQLKQGQFMAKGYYVYAPPIASQASADRAARKSVPFQVAAKLAGAVHTADITLNVNR
jgi:hypothetical protein